MAFGPWITRRVCEPFMGQQLSRCWAWLFMALGLWLGRQAVLGLVPSPSDLPLS